MKIVAIVPARGGSKRVPGKNIRSLGGLPLIVWSIRAARETGLCSDVIVSTDDEMIAAVAREAGATVDSLRPTALATDTATSVDVVLYELDQIAQRSGEADAILLLQPTSPFRSADTIRRGVELFQRHRGERSVVGFSATKDHPYFCFQVDEIGVSPICGWEALNMRSQDLPTAWRINGAFYLISVERLRAERRFLARDTLPLEMLDPAEGIDIDTEADWREAEASLQANASGGSF